jgi:hypothetical protein
MSSLVQIFKKNRGRARYIFVLALAVLVLLLALMAGRQAHAQGCSLCRDSVSGATPLRQAGFRRGIEVLGGGALLLIAGVAITAWRSRVDNE